MRAAEKVSIPALATRKIGAIVLAPCLLLSSAAQAQTAAPGPREGAISSLRQGAMKNDLAPFMKSQMFAGTVVLVANRDRVVDLETAGYADSAARKPMEPGSLFWVASMSKAVTAAALMMLVDEGKVGLDDPVEKYLPEFKGQMVEKGGSTTGDSTKARQAPASHPVTIREILSHTAGFSFSSTKEKAAGTFDTMPLKDAVASYAAEPLKFQPGTRFQYSNEGFNIAGRIIEVVSGMPYERFLQKRLLGPLGMKETTFWPSARQVGRLAKSYRRDESGQLKEVPINQLKYPLSDRKSRYPLPAGGLFSTAADMARFCQMLLNGGVFRGRRYLSESAVREMTTKQTPATVPTGYGFGLYLTPNGYKHKGAYNTEMSVDTQRGSILIFLVQYAGEWSTADEDRLKKAMSDRAGALAAAER